MKKLISFFIIFLLSYVSLEIVSFYAKGLPLYRKFSSHQCIKTPYLSNSPGYEVFLNNYSFRNAPDFHFPLKKEKPRLLLVGDSVMFGAPNSTSADIYLSKLLPKIETLNLSVPGANIPVYEKHFKNYYPLLKPDYIVVGLFLGNDFAGPMPEQRESLRFQFRQIIKKLFPSTIDFYRNYGKRGNELQKDYFDKCDFSALVPISVNTLKKQTIERVKILAQSMSLDVKKLLEMASGYDYDSVVAKYPNLLITSPSADLLSYAIVYRNYLADNLMLKNPNDVRNYEQALAVINSVIKFAEIKQIKLAFALLPASFAIDEKYVKFYKDLGYQNIEKVAENYNVYNRLKHDLLLKETEIIDLHSAENIKNAFFLEDWHMNDVGSRITAEEIAKWIEDK